MGALAASDGSAGGEAFLALVQALLDAGPVPRQPGAVAPAGDGAATRTTADDPDASDGIDRFAASAERWLVSVLMVSEGVDIPRLRVGVYATPARTELFFRQVVGRFVRRTPQPRRQMSYLLMPADPDLKLLAAQVEEERRHALELDEALEERDEPVERAQAGDGFTALSSNAHLEDVISSTTAPGDALLLFADEDSPSMATSAPVSCGMTTSVSSRWISPGCARATSTVAGASSATSTV